MLTPAAAINPNDDTPNVGLISGTTGGGSSSTTISGGQGFQQVRGSKTGGGASGGNGGKKKGKGKAGNKNNVDANHLLGFSVASNRVNAGELDMPH